MPQTKSAKKALRQAQKRRQANLIYLAKLKKTIKNTKKNPNSSNYLKVQSLIDKASKKHLISKNKAARLKSKLSKLLPKTQKKSKPNSDLTRKKTGSKLKKSQTKK